MSLVYFVSEKGTVVVISFKGTFDEAANTVLNECLKVVQDKAPKVVILHMGEVSEFLRGAHRSFALFAKGLKDLKIVMRVTGMSPGIRSQLMKEGLVSLGETKDVLEDALQEITGSVLKKSF